MYPWFLCLEAVRTFPAPGWEFRCGTLWNSQKGRAAQFSHYDTISDKIGYPQLVLKFFFFKQLLSVSNSNQIQTFGASH